MGLCTAPYKMLLFRAYTTVRGSCNIELAHLKKEEEEEEEEKHFGCFGAFWFSTFMMLFQATRDLVGHENTCIYCVY